MSTVDFLRDFQEFLGRHGWPTNQSPWSIVEQWERLVGQAASGYRWGFYEFTNELSVRDLLAKAFEDPLLRQYEPTVAMRDRVEIADNSFKELLMPGVEVGGPDKPWWRRGVLATGGTEYADDFKRLYGIDPRI